MGSMARWTAALAIYPDEVTLQVIRTHLLISQGRLIEGWGEIEKLSRNGLHSQKNKAFQAHVLNARYLTATGMLPAALSLLQLLDRDAADAATHCYVRNLLAINLVKVGDLDRAKIVLGSAAREGRRAGERQRLALVLQNQAMVLQRLREPVAALKALDKAIRLLQVDGGSIFLINAYLLKAWMLAGLQGKERAVAHVLWMDGTLAEEYARLPLPLRWKVDHIHRTFNLATPFYFPYRQFVPREFSWQLIESDLVLDPA